MRHVKYSTSATPAHVMPEFSMYSGTGRIMSQCHASTVISEAESDGSLLHASIANTAMDAAGIAGQWSICYTMR